MGAIWFRRIEFVTTIGELAGYKSGFAPSRQQILRHVLGFARYFDGDDDGQIRVRAETAGSCPGGSCGGPQRARRRLLNRTLRKCPSVMKYRRDCSKMLCALPAVLRA